MFHISCSVVITTELSSFILPPPYQCWTSISSTDISSTDACLQLVQRSLVDNRVEGSILYTIAVQRPSSTAL